MTQSETQNTLLAASLKVANLVNTNGTTLAAGGLTVEWGYINLVQRAINCVQRQYNLGDYVSAPFIIAYNRLLNYVGIDTGGDINPNAQGGLTIIIGGSTTGIVIKFTILAGTPIPFEYTYTLSDQPDVSFYIGDGSGGLTTNGATNITDNLIDGVLYIYGNPDGSGGFNEDTYVRIEV